MVATLRLEPYDGSAFAAETTEETALCGSVDLVLMIDTTFSLARAIREIKRQSIEITSTLETVSRGKFRVGLVTFKDRVHVLENLDGAPDPAIKAETVRNTIATLRARGGAGGPEASDEALNTVVNMLPAHGREQIGDFYGPWEGHSRIVVLITDNVPGGFDDDFAEGVDDRRFLTYAEDAAMQGIRVSTIYVPTTGQVWEPDDHITGVLRGPSAITGGLFTSTKWGGTGTAQALISILRSCGANQLS